jgi:excisionase family DNA binding protein
MKTADLGAPGAFWSTVAPVTVAELAAVARVSPAYVRKLVDAGALEARRVGRRLRIPASAARKFALEAGAEPPA